MKTPPPPLWGYEEEFDYDGTEEFYNHDRAMEEMKIRTVNKKPKSKGESTKKLKLKKKVFYTYEYASSDSDTEVKKDLN